MRDPPPARSRPRGGSGAWVRRRRAAQGSAIRRGARRDPGAGADGRRRARRSLVQPRVAPGPATYVGKGKLEELKHAYAESGAESLLVDDELAPSQQRRLENLAPGARRRPDAADPRHLRPARAQRRGQAPGRAGAARVQPAAHARHVAAPRAPRRRRRHARPRRVAARDRPPARPPARSRSSRGGCGSSASSATTRRKARRRSETPTIALAGYTNVGKSTLLNALTGAERRSTTGCSRRSTRRRAAFEHNGRRYLVTDTVGFIRRLPHQLVEGFAATLEETLVADLVLHVADASAPEDRARRAAARRQRRAGGDRRRRAAGRARPEQDRRGRLARRAGGSRTASPSALQVSARTGEGLDELRARIAERFADRFEVVELLVPYAEGGKLAELYALGPPIESRIDREDGVLIRARLPERDVRRFARFLVAGPAGRRRRRPRDRDPGHAAARRRGPADPGLPRRRRPRPRRLRAARARPRASARSSGRASPSRSRRGTPGWSRRARAWPPSTGSRSSTRRAWSTPATAASCG